MLVQAYKQASQPVMPHLPGDGDYRALVAGSRNVLRELAERLANGELTVREWAEEFYDELVHSHTAAWVLGRQRIGVSGDRDLMDIVAGRSIADSQADWLLRFMEAIEEGDPRYVADDGAIRADKVFNRSKFYTGRYRGTANEAMRDSAPIEAEAWWVLGAIEDHCSDCPQLEALSPYDRDTLFQVPGDNLTPCKFHCRCHIEWRLDGTAIDGFKPVT